MVEEEHEWDPDGEKAYEKAIQKTLKLQAELMERALEEDKRRDQARKKAEEKCNDPTCLTHGSGPGPHVIPLGQVANSFLKDLLANPPPVTFAEAVLQVSNAWKEIEFSTLHRAPPDVQSQAFAVLLSAMEAQRQADWRSKRPLPFSIGSPPKPPNETPGGPHDRG